MCLFKYKPWIDDLLVDNIAKSNSEVVATPTESFEDSACLPAGSNSPSLNGGAKSANLEVTEPVQTTKEGITSLKVYISMVYTCVPFMFCADATSCLFYTG